MPETRVDAVIASKRKVKRKEPSDKVQKKAGKSESGSSADVIDVEPKLESRKTFKQFLQL